MSTEAPYEIAIVGGGIVGVVLAAGLVHRNIKVKLFEQARNFSEIGAGIGFTSNTVRCMQQINPAIVEALRGSGAVHGSTDSSDPNAYFRYLDGYLQLDPSDLSYQQPLYQLDAGPRGWETVRRDHFLMELVKRLPESIFQLRTKLENVEQQGSDGKVILTFTDGSTHTADALIACDGLKSKTRQILLGPEDPASYPQYSHKVAYRTLVPMDKVLEALGEYKTHRLHFHLGPGAHLLHYPVNEKMIGSAVYVNDPEDWPLGSPLTAWGVREDVQKVVAGWSEPVRKLVDLFPEKLEKWALFDMFEYPLKKYNFGRIALAGDAAHATSPHHGAGASFGVEDVLCLSTLFDQATTALNSHRLSKNKTLELVLETFDEVRRGRTQWLVNSSRRTCDIYQQPEWGNPLQRIKAETTFEEIKDRSFKIWHFDSTVMVKETKEKFEKHLSENSKAVNGESSTNGHSTIIDATTNENSTTTIDAATNGNTPVIDAATTAKSTTNGVAAAVEETSETKYDWLAHIPDHPNMLSTRIANIKDHMANLAVKKNAGLIIMGGPLLSEMDIQSASQQPKVTGSVQVLKASSEVHAWDILKEDPYAKLGVWDLGQTKIQPMRVGMMASLS